MDPPDIRSSLLVGIEHPLLRRIVEFWLDRRHGKRWPSRSDFDVLDLKFALGYLSLIDVHQTPRRYFYRLDGTFQAELFGVDCTGKFLDSVTPPEDYAFVHRIFSEVADTGMPQHFKRDILFHHRPVKYEVAILPLSKTATPGQQTADMLMTAVIPQWKR